MFKQDYLSYNEELKATLYTVIGYNSFEVIDFLAWCMLPQRAAYLKVQDSGQNYVPVVRGGIA